MKFFLATAILIAGANFSQAALFTNSISVDAFVRGNAPAANYGAAGSLTVSGSTATNAAGTANGVADSFIRFNTSALVANLNSLFGPNNWAISGVTLRVVEVGAPMNTIFTRGKGTFEIRWTSNDSWIEGTGMPMAPTDDGITYNDEPPLLTNTVSLGTFTNAGINSTESFSLALSSALTSDISAGGEVGLYLTALDPEIGFTFNSQNFTTANQRPVVIVSAAPVPGTTGIVLSGNDAVIAGTNGVAGGTYVVLSTTNLLSPLNQWTPIATNALETGGAFTIRATNALSNPSAQQFFLLQAQ
ncbi:MAG TPA: hypothetical protein VG938_02140 [Verrucomicrobiae bacterium]|jgi:hypothetical protein|nr:hypothetical protein [Verrucomicrobiae bacterium]